MSKVKFRVPIQRRKYKMPFLLMKKKRVEAVRRSLKQPSDDQMELRKDERVVWNVAERSEKVGYDPKTGTNWCHLPMEIRMKCIGEMDLVTGIHLSATSKTEKSLVESKTYRLDYVSIENSMGKLNVIGCNKKRDDFISSQKKSDDVKVQLALYLLQKCEYKKLTCSGYSFSGKSSSEIAFLKRLVPFRCRKFESYGHNQTSVRFILSNCTRLETITFSQESVFEKLALFPAVVNANEVRLSNYAYSSGVWDLVRKWIEIDAEVGKSVQFMSSSLCSVEDFTSAFADRILQSDEEEVTIKTNNKDKEILLSNYGYCSRELELENDYISIEVISARPPYSGRYREKWIEKRCREEEDEKRKHRWRRGW